MSKRNIKNFNGFNIKIDYQKVIDKYSEQTQKDLKATSPKSNRPSRKNPYAQGWETKKTQSSRGYDVIVWNKTNYQLTHLLENGHFITNAKSGNVGWSPPKPHIKPAYEKVKPKFIKAMKNVDIEITNK